MIRPAVGGVWFHGRCAFAEAWSLVEEIARYGTRVGPAAVPPPVD